jgi:hypothetical protein
MHMFAFEGGDVHACKRGWAGGGEGAGAAGETERWAKREVAKAGVLRLSELHKFQKND